MSLKTIFFGIITFLTLTISAQSEKNKGFEIQSSVTTFRISTDNLEELKNIDWNGIKEAFESNKKDDLVTISIAYNKKIKETTNRTEVETDSFKIETSGKSANIDKQIDNLQRILQKYIDMQKS